MVMHVPVPDPDHVPWLQVCVRLPRAGATLSFAVELLPWATVDVLPLHVLLLTVQVWLVPEQLRFEEHEALVPPLLPLQLQVYGPVPLTAVALPLPHRLVVGALVELPPLAAPHAPSTAVTQVPVPEPLQVPWLHV